MINGLICRKAQGTNEKSHIKYCHGFYSKNKHQEHCFLMPGFLSAFCVTDSRYIFTVPEPGGLVEILMESADPNLKEHNTDF